MIWHCPECNCDETSVVGYEERCGEYGDGFYVVLECDECGCRFSGDHLTHSEGVHTIIDGWITDGGTDEDFDADEYGNKDISDDLGLPC